MKSPGTSVAAITAMAIALAEDHDSDELALLGASFTQLGDTLSTLSLQRARLESSKGEGTNSNEQSNESTSS